MGKDNDIDNFTEEEDDALNDPGFEDDQEIFEDEAFGDEEFLDEEWSDLDAGAEAGENVTGKKKKKPNLIIMGGGAAVALLAVIFMMGGGQQPVPQNPGPGAGKQAPVQPPPTVMDIVTGKAQEDDGRQDSETKLGGGMLNDVDALKKIENIRDQFVFEEHVIGPEEDEAWPGQPRVVYEDPPMPAPMQAADVLTPMPETGSQPAPASSSGEAGALTKADSTETEGPRMSKAADFLKSAGSPDSEPETVPTGLTKKIDQIAARLEEIDNRLSRIEKESVKSKDFAALKTDVARLQGARPADTRANDKAATAAPSVKKASSSSVNAAAGARTSSATTADSWVLKAAQPGNAYVSQKGKQEVIALKVGDSLPGIGKVRDIRMEDGMWVVVGSQGRILQ